jgi:hypothetical protein
MSFDKICQVFTQLIISLAETRFTGEITIRLKWQEGGIRAVETERREVLK